MKVALPVRNLKWTSCAPTSGDDSSLEVRFLFGFCGPQIPLRATFPTFSHVFFAALPGRKVWWGPEVSCLRSYCWKQQNQFSSLDCLTLNPKTGNCSELFPSTYISKTVARALVFDSLDRCVQPVLRAQAPKSCSLVPKCFPAVRLWKRCWTSQLFRFLDYKIGLTIMLTLQVYCGMKWTNICQTVEMVSGI